MANNQSRKSHKRSASSSVNVMPSAAPRLLCIRSTLFLLVLAITVLSLYFSYTLTTLYNQVQSDTEHISALQTQVSAQKSIIDRFNTSTTNADVEQHVAQLEQSLIQTETDMKHSLDVTTHSIQLLLNSTVDKLDRTVAAAETEIHSEVNLVKTDVQSYVRTTQDQFSMENSFMKFQLAGTFCLLAILISMWHMTAHIRKFQRPFVQRKILAILWMSPIYAVTSWLSLVFPRFEGYLSIVKDFYEAYVIYQFLGFCISVLGSGNRQDVVDLLANHSDHLDPPMRFCGWCRKSNPYPTSRDLASAVLMQCQVFAMQFVFLKPLTAVGLFTCDKYDFCDLDPSHTNHTVILGLVPMHYLESPVVWLRIIQNISVFMAFSGLLKFYHSVQDDLAWCNPFPKFLCIKGIVFMTFWQGLIISFLASTTIEASGGNGSDGDSASDGGDDPDLWGKQAQNFLICLEMLLFSIAHFYCFPTDEWQEGYRPASEKKLKGLDNMAFGDFVADLKLIMTGNIQNEKKKRKFKNTDKKDDEKHEEAFFTILKDENGENVKKEKVELIDAGDIEEGNANDNDNTLDSAQDDEVPKDKDDEIGGDDILDEEAVDANVNLTVDISLDDETMDQLLSESIRESLSARNTEEREAAHRMLRNRMTGIDRISKPSSSNGDISAASASSNYQKETESNLVSNDSTYGAVSAADVTVSEYNAMTPMGGGLCAITGDVEDDDINNVAGETTSLLGKRNEDDFSMSAMNNFG